MGKFKKAAAPKTTGAVLTINNPTLSSKTVSSVSHIVPSGDAGEDTVLPISRYAEPRTAVTSSTPAVNGANGEDAQGDTGMLDPENAGATLAERLHTMTMQRGETLSAEQLEATLTDDKTPSTSTNTTGPAPIAPAAGLSQTLVQALHSTDARLLESCFQHTDKRTISATVRRLPKQLVLTLVDELVLRLGRGRRGQAEGMSAAHAKRAKGLVEWVRQVLVVHVGYLVTIPSLVARLSALHTTLQSRLDLHQKLLSLNGRLELVTSHIEMRRDAPVAAEEVPRSKPWVKKEPTKYVEGESSDSDEEDVGDDEGSVEDIVLGSASGSESDEDDEEEDSEDDDDEDEDEDDGDSKDEDDEEEEEMSSAHGINGFLELEAEESGSDDGEGDDDDGGEDEIMVEATGFEESEEDDEEEDSD